MTEQCELQLQDILQSKLYQSKIALHYLKQAMAEEKKTEKQYNAMGVAFSRLYFILGAEPPLRD